MSTGLRCLTLGLCLLLFSDRSTMEERECSFVTVLICTPGYQVGTHGAESGRFTGWDLGPGLGVGVWTFSFHGGMNTVRCAQVCCDA